MPNPLSQRVSPLIFLGRRVRVHLVKAGANRTPIVAVTIRGTTVTGQKRNGLRRVVVRATVGVGAIQSQTTVNRRAGPIRTATEGIVSGECAEGGLECVHGLV
jgi:hypothetical protein